MGGSEGGDFLEDHSDGDGGSSEGGEHDEDGSGSDDGEGHEMPLPAEDDYEDGLQDMDGDMAMNGAHEGYRV